MTIYNIALEWQSLIVGAFGFAGVAYTIHSNFKHRQLERNQQTIDRRLALKAALLAELKINNDWVSTGIETIKSSKNESNLLMPTSGIDLIFRSHQDQLGLLNTKQVQLIINAYLSFESSRSRYLILGIKPVDGTYYFNFPNKYIDVALVNSEHTADRFQKAIESLEKDTLV